MTIDKQNKESLDKLLVFVKKEDNLRNYEEKDLQSRYKNSINIYN